MTGPKRTFLYVSCSAGNSIDVLTLDAESGALSLIESAPLPGNGMPLALAPNKRHLYAAVAGNDEIGGPKLMTFEIDQTHGTLHHRATIDAPGRMSHITCDRSGHHLLGASVSNALISSHRILPGGAIAPEPTNLHAMPGKAHHITTDITNRFAYVPNLAADRVSQFEFDAETGGLASITPADINQPEGAAPRHMAHHPAGRFAYLLNEENGTVAAFTITAATGALSEIQTSSYLPAGFSGKPWGAQILVPPNGRFLYTSERNSSTLTLHTIDQTSGMLTRQQSWPTETCPRNFTITPSGRHLIAAGEQSASVAAYAIDSETGDLDIRATLPTSTGPLWIEALELP